MGTDPLIHALHVIHQSPPKLQSNFARDHSQVIARLASCGLISTEVPPKSGMFGYHWRVTLKGLRVLDALDEE